MAVRRNVVDSNEVGESTNFICSGGGVGIRNTKWKIKRNKEVSILRGQVLIIKIKEKPLNAISNSFILT